MNVTIDIDLEKFRYSLVGDGYLLKEVAGMSNEDLIGVLERRVNSHILVKFHEGIGLGLYNKLTNNGGNI